MKTEKVTVTWQPRFSSDVDFLMPGEGCGSKKCGTPAEAKAFAKKLEEDGITVRGNIPIFGSELEIEIK